VAQRASHQGLADHIVDFEGTVIAACIKGRRHQYCLSVRCRFYLSQAARVVVDCSRRHIESERPACDQCVAIQRGFLVETGTLGTFCVRISVTTQGALGIGSSSANAVPHLTANAKADWRLAK
jgi:hypothetical protein